MRHPRRRRRGRDRDGLVLRVREAQRPYAKYRVRAPITVGEADVTTVRDLMLEGLRGLGLEARVTGGDGEVVATLEVEAAAPAGAKEKANYWLQRAARRVSTRQRRLTPTGGTNKMTVEEV